MAPTLFSLDRMLATYRVSPDMLRLYEKRGLLRPVLVGEARFYSAPDRVRLEIVLKGKRFGFSLGEIEALVLGTQGPRVEPVGVPLDRDHVIEQLRSLVEGRDNVGVMIAGLKALLGSK